MSAPNVRLRRAINVVGCVLTVQHGGVEETVLICHERTPPPGQPARCWWSSPTYGLSSTPSHDQVPPSWVELAPEPMLRAVHLALQIGVLGGRS
jgi:hypothetical protein